MNEYRLDIDIKIKRKIKKKSLRLNLGKDFSNTSYQLHLIIRKIFYTILLDEF